MNYSENDLPDLRIDDDPEFREIEDLLRRLPVQEPSMMIDRRIEALARRTGRVDAWRYVGLGAAAIGFGIGRLFHSRVVKLQEPILYS